MPQDILITPYKDSTSSGAKIDFTGFNSGASTITMRILPDSTLSYEGTAGQLFSISNGLSSGTIFSVNDISGIPSIDVASSGLVRLAPFVGEVQTNKLYVQANPQSGTQTVQEWRNLSGTAMASVNTSGQFAGYLASGTGVGGSSGQMQFNAGGTIGGSAAVTFISGHFHLNVNAQDLVVYISDAVIKINEMEGGVNDSVEFIVKIGTFIQEIPSKIQQDIQSVQGVGNVINELGYLVDSIKEISFQTDILAVNAAIQAAHAGEAGLGFKIVADEVRKLAVSSNSAAEMIEAGLATARITIQNGLKFKFLDDIMTQMNEAAHVMDAIKKLEETREDSRQYYKTLFDVINNNNQKLAGNTSDILSSIQYQDIVSQRIERMRDMLQQRNNLFQSFVEELESSNGNLVDDFSGKMNSILVDYIELESNHHNSLNSVDLSSKFELF